MLSQIVEKVNIILAYELVENSDIRFVKSRKKLLSSTTDDIFLNSSLSPYQARVFVPPTSIARDRPFSGISKFRQEAMAGPSALYDKRLLHGSSPFCFHYKVFPKGRKWGQAATASASCRLNQTTFSNPRAQTVYSTW